MVQPLGSSIDRYCPHFAKQIYLLRQIFLFMGWRPRGREAKGPRGVTQELGDVYAPAGQIWPEFALMWPDLNWCSFYRSCPGPPKFDPNLAGSGKIRRKPRQLLSSSGQTWPNSGQIRSTLPQLWQSGDLLLKQANIYPTRPISRPELGQIRTISVEIKPSSVHIGSTCFSRFATAHNVEGRARKARNRPMPPRRWRRDASSRLERTCSPV